MAAHQSGNDQTTGALQPSQSIVNDFQEPPIISPDASPPSVDQRKINIRTGSLGSPLMEIEEKSAHLKLSNQSSRNSLRDLNSPPGLALPRLEKGFKKNPPIPDSGAEIIPLEDDPGCRVVTFRSVVVGVFLSALGASVTQLFYFKPVHMQIKLPFLQIVAFIIGRSLALLPGPQWWNPGPFSLKETAFSGLMAAAAGVATIPAEMIAVYELYFGHVINFGVALGILVGAQLLAYGWAGLLQPMLIYPSRAVYPEALPSVSLLNSLYKVGSKSDDQVKFFKKAFLAIGLYEIIPSYIAPAFQAINVFCLTLPKNQLITNIFGGARPFEGMGIFSISLDWSLAGGRGPLFMPLSTQIHEIVALVVSIFAFFLVYSKSWLGAGLNQNFPFLSASLLTADGKPYPYRQAINADGTANEEFIQTVGLPSFTATFYLIQILTSVYLTSSLSHAFLHNYHLIGPLLKKLKSPEEIDPHRVVCQKYRDFPLWGFAVSLLLNLSQVSYKNYYKKYVISNNS